MDALKTFAAVLVFLFMAFLFPTLKSEIDNYAGSGGATPLIQAFPYILLVMSLIPALYMIGKGVS